uniref:Uncharacterized protein n=1 Tax=Bursaphelenchus xylophilus TaxID=6326 RepID=A0A1I7SKC1_BURXY
MANFLFFCTVQRGCTRTCYQDQVFRACGCADPRFVYDPPVYCNTFNDEQARCLYNFTNQEPTGRYENCICYPPCDHELFTAISLSSKWPKKEFDVEDCSLHSSEDCALDYQKNGAEIVIFFPHGSHVILIENPTTT